MAIISTLLSGFSITDFIYKVFITIVFYWCFHISSQLVSLLLCVYICVHRPDKRVTDIGQV
jgi:hypothetical protein